MCHHRVELGLAHQSWPHAACVTIGVMCHVAVRLIWVGSVLVTSGFWTLRGRSWSCHIHIWKTKVHDVSYKLHRNDKTTSRWCAAAWINIIIEKHAWLSAGLIWMPSASDSGNKGEYSDPRPEEPASQPTINFFELWEDGSQ